MEVGQKEFSAGSLSNFSVATQPRVATQLQSRHPTLVFPLWLMLKQRRAARVVVQPRAARQLQWITTVVCHNIDVDMSEQMWIGDPKV